MSEQQDGLAELGTFIPEHTLEYYRTKRTENGNKRNYVFDYSRSRSCDHVNLRAVARGGIEYRCMDCNYVFTFPGGYQQPIHHRVIMAAFEMFHFSKEFGMDSLGEVLRTPIGQSDGTAHKPVLPEGMSFVDVLHKLEKVNVNTPDGGAKQLYEMIDEVFVDAKSRAKRLEELAGIDRHRRPAHLGPAYDPDLPSLQEAASDALPDGSQEQS